MQQPQDKRSRLKRSVLLLFLLFLVIASLLLAAFIFTVYKGNNPEQPVVSPIPNPNEGSFSENVQGIQINMLTLSPLPEFNFGGTLTGFLACFACFAIFMIHKNRSKRNGHE